MNKAHLLLRALYHRFIRGNELKDHIRRGLKVGRNFKMLEEVKLDHSHIWHIEIGDDVTLAPRVHILAHDASTRTHLGSTRIGKVTIGDRVFVGASSIILPGVTISDDVVIGAGSVVTHDIPPGSVAAGNPARVIGTLDAFLDRRHKEMQAHPCFGEEYTVEKHLSDAMKADMNARMQDRIGYVT